MTENKTQRVNKGAEDPFVTTGVSSDQPHLGRAINRRRALKLSTLIGISLPIVITLTPTEARAQASS